MGTLTAEERQIALHFQTKSMNMVVQERNQEVFMPIHLVGMSEKFLRALFLSAVFAPTEASVLIIGETGTGKEELTKAVHYSSPRANGPFVPINCAAIPEPIFESIMFGHERGAFTGAVARKKGLFEIAKNGTLYLDQAGDISADSQTKLLRAIENGDVHPLGAEKALRAKPRIICSVSTDFLGKRETKKFRDDLYYRVGVGVIFLPPLRARREDIPILAEHFLEQKDHHFHLSAEANDRLMDYSWPGNIRELANVIERAVIVARATQSQIIFSNHIMFDHELFESIGLIETLSKPLEGAIGFLIKQMEKQKELTIREIQRELILGTLDSCEGNKFKAAGILGITSKTILRYKREREEKITGREG